MTTVMEEKRYNPRLTKSREEFIQLMKTLNLDQATENQMGKIFLRCVVLHAVNSLRIFISIYRTFLASELASRKSLFQHVQISVSFYTVGLKSNQRQWLMFSMSISYIITRGPINASCERECFI